MTVSDRTTLIRLFRLIQLLGSSRRGLTLRELADELEVSQRSIRRDLAALDEAGFRTTPVREEHGRKRWRLDGDSQFFLSGLTVDEAAALYLGRRLLEPLAGTLLWDSVQSASWRLQLGRQVIPPGNTQVRMMDQQRLFGRQLSNHAAQTGHDRRMMHPGVAVDE